MSIVMEVQTAPLLTPPKPVSLEATGLAADTLASILIKMLHGGEASGMGLADRVCLPYGILEPLLEKLRVELLDRSEERARDRQRGLSIRPDRRRAELARSGTSTRAGMSGPLPFLSISTRSHMNRLRAQTHDVLSRARGAKASRT